MKLGTLTQYYLPEMGAPQGRLSELAARFVERGHEVTVLTAMPNYPAGKVMPGYGGVYRRERLNGVDVVRCWIYPTHSVCRLRRLAGYGSFVASSAAFGAFALSRLDYLLTESPPLFLGISGYLLARLKRARWIFNVSDLWPESAVRLGVIGRGIALRAAARLEAWCYRRAWLVSGQSKGILNDIRARFPGVPTYHLSNGADTSAFAPERANPEVRRLLGEPGECLVVYAGLHGIAQGIDQVLETARRLDGRVRVRFDFIGDGPEKRRLVVRARDQGLHNVRFLGPLPRQQMPAVLASADIALVPLKLDLPGAVPSKIYEAMASGLPVVLAGDGEPAAIVRDASAGVVIRPGDIAALETAVCDLARNAAARAEFGRNGRRAAVERFDRQAIADRFVSYLEDGLRAAPQWN